MVLGARAGQPGRLIPAVALRGLDQPLGSDLHAERREHRVARVGESCSAKVPPHSSPLAFSSSTPSISARLSTGKLVRGLDQPVLERGRGCHDLERRARRLGRRERDAGQRPDLARCAGPARRRRRAGRRARSPRPPAACVSIVERAGGAGRGADARQHPRPAPAGSPPGTPRHLSSKMPLEPGAADRRVRREPAREELRRTRPSSLGCPRVPAIEDAERPSGDVRAWPVPPPAPFRPRTGSARAREPRCGASARSPSRRPGKASCGPQSIASSSTPAARRGRERRRRPACRTVTGTATRSPLGCGSARSRHEARGGGGRRDLVVGRSEHRQRVARPRLGA